MIIDDVEFISQTNKEPLPYLSTTKNGIMQWSDIKNLTDVQLDEIQAVIDLNRKTIQAALTNNRQLISYIKSTLQTWLKSLGVSMYKDDAETRLFAHYEKIISDIESANNMHIHGSEYINTRIQYNKQIISTKHTSNAKLWFNDIKNSVFIIDRQYKQSRKLYVSAIKYAIENNICIDSFTTDQECIDAIEKIKQATNVEE